MTDAIRPDHYKLIVRGKEIECIDVIEALGLGFHLGSALKYAWRLGRKHERFVEEIGKCRWYLDRWHEKVAGAANTTTTTALWYAMKRAPVHAAGVTIAHNHEQLAGNLRGLCMVAEQKPYPFDPFDPRPYMLELITLFDLEDQLCA